MRARKKYTILLVQILFPVESNNDMHTEIKHPILKILWRMISETFHCLFKYCHDVTVPSKSEIEIKPSWFTFSPAVLEGQTNYRKVKCHILYTL